MAQYPLPPPPDVKPPPGVRPRGSQQQKQQQPPAFAAPGAILQLYTQRSTLQKRISDLQIRHGLIGADYATLNPAVVHNPMVHITQRQCLSLAYDHGADMMLKAHVDRLLHYFHAMSAFLGKNQVKEAATALSGAKSRLKQAEEYLQGLDNAVKGHQAAEQYYRERGWLVETPGSSSP